MQKFSVLLIALGTSRSLFGGIASVETMQADSGCGSLQYDIAESPSHSDSSQAITGESLRVFFNDFHIQSSAPGTVQRTCKLNAVIRIPARFRFLPRAAYAEGSYSLQPQGSSKGTIQVSYDVKPVGRSAKRNNEATPWTGDGDFICKGELEEKQFLICANHDSFVTLATDLSLKIQQSAPGQSLIELDTARKDVDLSWDWQLKPCVNYFEGESFRAYMKIGSNSTLPLRFLPYEDKGSLVTDSGVHGSLMHLVYSDDGRSVAGRYEIAGQSGRFDVEVKDTESGEFRGNLVGDDGSKGSFFGYKAEF